MPGMHYYRCREEVWGSFAKRLDFLLRVVDKKGNCNGSPSTKASFSAIFTFSYLQLAGLRIKREAGWDNFHVSTALITTTSLIVLNFIKGFTAVIVLVDFRRQTRKS